MITNLIIQNYALIDDISVEFNSGLTTITGETGAGKSILLGALSLLLGKRAELSSVKNKTKKCVIEGEFSIAQYDLQKLFESVELDFDSTTIVRREILPSGKTRAFVNDTPVTLQQLNTVAPYLVDIHSQHETLAMFSETYQLEVIDVLAGNAPLLGIYSNQLRKFKEVSETLSELLYKKETASKELDYNTFLFRELEEAGLAQLIQQDLEDAYEKLSNTEVIQESLSKGIQLIDDEQYGTLETAKEARTTISALRGFSSEYEDFWNRVNSVILELEDILEELRRSMDAVEADPGLLLEVNEKLQTLYKLQQKHNVETVEELLKIHSSLDDKIDVTMHMEGHISELEEQQEKLKKEMRETGEKLHASRMDAIPTLKQKLEDYLNKLGLPNARFQFDLVSSESFRKNGTDQLQLLFTANKGLAFGPLKKVASGGELSRIMLAVKAVLASYKQLPTLIFDEIDTGVSGEVANKMAEILHSMSQTMQMICITHLPQIAGKGDHHLKIYKEDINEVTQTRLSVLTKGERIKEIAEMIGGNSHSKAALLHAKALLN